MKRIISLCMCLVLCCVCSACGVDNETKVNQLDSNNISTILLLDKENVKISFCGTSPDVGVGEGIILQVENTRTESIIVNISEVSLNDVMQVVIQPQMPLNLISPGKQSNQSFIFSNVKDLNGNAQFKIKILSENYEELFISDFVEVSF